MTSRRIAGGVILSGLVIAANGVRLELARADAHQVSNAAAPAAADLTTPVLSARRAPELLVQPQAARRLATQIMPILAGAPADTCISVVDGGASVFDAQPELAMAAASNQKLLTALAALDTFGPDHRFLTRIAATAAPVDGSVPGDLWVIGGGDPVIDTDTYQQTLRYGRTERTRLEDIADAVVAAGVRSVSGSVRGDESRFDAVRTIPSWPARYLAQNQVGPLSALSVNDARTFPAVAPPPGVAAPTPQPAADPAAYAASALTDLLRQRGVSVSGPPGSGVAPTGVVAVHDHESLPLRAILKEMLTFSDNNTAELLIKAIGHEVSGEGTTAAGLAAMSDALARRGLDLDGVVLTDGSGLDTGNRITCRLLEQVLGVDGPDGPIAEGLAVADGDVGTLRDRFTNSPAAGAVRAKTGTLNKVTALSGWVRTSAGRDLRFATIVNTGERNVTDADLQLEARVAEAALTYPDAVDPEAVAPR